jgi:hypothetical protein
MPTVADCDGFGIRPARGRTGWCAENSVITAIMGGCGDCLPGFNPGFP